MPNKRNYLTSVGYEKLEREYRALIDVERPAVVRVVSWAASNGDRSENGDYIYGKRKLREIDKRILFLKNLLATATIVNISDQDHSRIFFGATVVLDITTAESQTTKTVSVTLVGEQETDMDKGKINFKSPLGLALLKKEKGDQITLTLAQQTQEIRIIDFYYTEACI